MYTEKITLNVKTGGADENFNAALNCFIPDICTAQRVPEGGRTAIIICPGGGYRFKSDREGEVVALRFASEGIATFVLDYSVAPAVFPQSVCEAAEALNIVRKNAEKWSINPNKILLCGFSAGGHLSASLGVFFDSDEVLKNTGLTADECKPNGLILAYPVITGGKFAHQDSFAKLSGKEYSEEMAAAYSLENFVKENTPPAFIWHTYEDTTVPVENSVLFFSALREKGVNAELHIFPHKEHGLSLAKEVTGPTSDEASIWVDLALRWIKNL